MSIQVPRLTRHVISPNTKGHKQWHRTQQRNRELRSAIACTWASLQCLAYTEKCGTKDLSWMDCSIPLLLEVRVLHLVPYTCHCAIYNCWQLYKTKWQPRRVVYQHTLYLLYCLWMNNTTSGCAKFKATLASTTVLILRYPKSAQALRSDIPQHSNKADKSKPFSTNCLDAAGVNNGLSYLYFSSLKCKGQNVVHGFQTALHLRHTISFMDLSMNMNIQYQYSQQCQHHYSQQFSYSSGIIQQNLGSQFCTRFWLHCVIPGLCQPETDL